jgi:gluconolactonase
MIFASDLEAPEGPVVLPDGSWVIVESGAKRGSVTHISADGRTKRVVRDTGRPNGLAVDAAGAIWVAESKTPSLLRLTLDGHVDVVATECDGEPFLFPNDLCFGPDGALYLTDSGIRTGDFAPGDKIRPDYRELRYDGRVYRVDPLSGKTSKLDTGILFTNGIAFGSDGLLYVNETITGAVYRYDGKRVPFGNVIRPDSPPGWRGPDGMAFGDDDRLYVTVFGQGDVTVLGGEGQVIERIATEGRLPTNVAFGLAGSRRMYITEFEFGRIEMFDTATDGLPLWTGARS